MPDEDEGPDALGGAKEAGREVAAALHGLLDGLLETFEASETLADAKSAVHEGAQVARESGRRALAAPRKIGHELRMAIRAWVRGVATTLALVGVMAIFTLVALIVLTIALVVGLNALLGDPAGTFMVAGLDLLIIAIAFWSMRSRRAAATREIKRRMANSRDHVRHVAQPARQAFERTAPSAKIHDAP